jgi:DMSO/TMAO reductase YedYZ heme-binding membrane subunit
LASVAAIIHVAIYAEGAYHWNLLWFVVEKHHGEIVFSRSGFALANWVGAVALLYAVVLALTANDFAQHLLGRGWKLLQQQSYTLYVLTVLHAVVFTYVRLAPGVFTYALWGGIIVTVGMQVVGYIWTLVHQGRSPLGGDEVVRRGVRASLPCRSRHHW